MNEPTERRLVIHIIFFLFLPLRDAKQVQTNTVGLREVHGSVRLLFFQIVDQVVDPLTAPPSDWVASFCSRYLMHTLRLFSSKNGEGSSLEHADFLQPLSVPHSVQLPGCMTTERQRLMKKH